MGVTRLVSVGAFAFACLVVATASAQSSGLRISYAEPLSVDARSIRPDSTSTKPEAGSLLSFEAYGRRFDLELVSNARLLNALAPERKTELANHTLYAGTVRGLAGSWVRLTRSGHELRAAVWDGTDLYLVEPMHDAAPFLISPIRAAPSQAVIYRLADTFDDTKRSCSVVSAGASAQTALAQTALGSYQELVAELRQIAMTVPQKQIEIAVLGDNLYVTRLGTSLDSHTLFILNMVDGIFSEQVGVQIVVPELRMFTAGDPPQFATNVAGDLLDGLSEYRVNTPEIRDQGLAHLLTGRDLDGTTAGVAFLDTLCDAETGVSLSEGAIANFTSSLIMAHELGHNFGAPHDGEAGSPCVGTPTGFLMSPFIGSNEQFSQCSLDQMRPRVEAAGCITQSSLVDARVVSPMEIQAVAHTEFSIPIEVSSIGTAVVTGATLQVNFSGGSLDFVSATVPQGSCAPGGNGVTCQFDDIPVGETRNVVLRVRGTNQGTLDAVLGLTAPNDKDQSNNHDATRIVLTSGADAVFTTEPTPVVGFTDRELSFALIVRSVGPDTLRGATLRLSPFGVHQLSVVPSSGTCSLVSGVECLLGDIPANETRRVEIRGTPFVPAGDHFWSVNLFGSNDGNPFNNALGFNVRFDSARDAAVEVGAQPVDAVVGTPFTRSVTVRSVGIEAAANLRVTLHPEPGLEIQNASAPGMACAIQFSVWLCTADTLAPGESRIITVRMMTTEAGSMNLRATVDSTGDEHSGNDFRTLQIRSRHAVDVGWFAINSMTSLQTRTATLQLRIESFGANPAPNVRMTLTGPPSLNFQAARMNGATCTVGPGSVTCTAPLVSGPDTRIEVDYAATEVGSFQGSVVISADGDAVASNNSGTFSFNVEPFVDVGLTTPVTTIFGVVGDTFDVPASITTSIHAVPSVQLSALFSGEVTLVSFQSPVGSCTTDSQGVHCQLGTLPANSNFDVLLRVRSHQGNVGTGVIGVFSAADRDPVNNSRPLRVDVRPPSDAALSVNNAAITLNQTADLQFSIAVGSSLLGTGQVRVEVPAGLAIIFADLNGTNPCPITNQVVVCPWDLLPPSETLRVNMRLRGEAVGNYQVTGVMSASNDTNSQNNSSTATLAVSAAPPPPPPPPPPPANNSGGGGGGSLGWLILAVLAGMQAATLRRMPRRVSLAA